MLVGRNRTALIKTLVERCAVREVDTTSLAATLEAAYGGPHGFEITQLLKSSTTVVDPPVQNGKNHNQSDKLHGSLLAQAMIAVPGRLSSLILDSFARLGAPLSLAIARDSISSHALQAALTSPNATAIFRRKMIQQFYGHVAEMALDPAASHVIDAVWTGTSGLAFIRERIAEELAEAEPSLRESHVGRAVWRNWKMDLYKRRRKDWVLESRHNAGFDGFMPFPEANESGEERNGNGLGRNGEVAKHLSAIEKARLRHAQEKATRKKNESSGKGKEKERPSTAVAV
jgi:nucleolar protein 9